MCLFFMYIYPVFFMILSYIIYEKTILYLKSCRHQLGICQLQINAVLLGNVQQIPNCHW